MKISIIISTYNGCQKLKILLNALKKLSLSDANACEVLIVDNNSSDDTKKVVGDYLSSENPTFKYLFEKRQGKSHALNLGIREADGEILVFTDDDCVPDSYWIESIVNEFESDPSLSVLGGRVELYDKEDRPHSISYSTKRVKITHPREVCRIPLIMGNNMAIRRNVFDVISEFDPLLGPGSICGVAEDTEFLYRIYKREYKMVYSPEALVFHKHGRKTQQEDDAVNRGYGMGRGGLYFKHILRLDYKIVGIACEEVYSLSKTLLKGFLVRKNFRYHRITLPALFAGAFRYYKASMNGEKLSKQKNL